MAQRSDAEHRQKEGGLLLTAAEAEAGGHRLQSELRGRMCVRGACRAVSETMVSCCTSQSITRAEMTRFILRNAICVLAVHLDPRRMF